MFCICLFSAASLFPAVIFGSVAMGGNIFLSLLNNCLAARGAHFSLYWWRISWDVWEIFPVLSSRGELAGLMPSFDIASYFFFFFNFLPWNVLRQWFASRATTPPWHFANLHPFSRCPGRNTSWGGCSESQAITSVEFLISGAQERPASPNYFPGLITFQPISYFGFFDN